MAVTLPDHLARAHHNAAKTEKEHPVPVMCTSLFHIVPSVLGVLEHDALPFGNLKSPDAAEQLGRLAREHGPKDELDLSNN